MNYAIATSLLVLFIVLAIATPLLVLFIVLIIPIIYIIILHYNTKALEKYLHHKE